MKRKLKLRPFVIPLIYTLFVITLLTTVFINNKSYKKDKDENNLTYVSSSIFDTYTPVINTEAKILRPYTSSDVTIGKDYYSSNDNQETQNNSIIYYSNTYMPNSGIDYVLDKTFDVQVILDGEVIEVKDEELLGKTVTIRHTTDLISIYQSLSEVSVEKGEQVSIGQVIGKSGTNELSKDLGNHLHFELIYKGQNVDPENYFDKKISELED